MTTCAIRLNEIIAEVRQFGASMLGTDNIDTAKASIEAIGALRRLVTAIDNDCIEMAEWPSGSQDNGTPRHD